MPVPLSRQISQGKEIDRYTGHLFQLDLQTAEIEQGNARKRIDQNVQITGFIVATVKAGAEAPSIADSMSSHCPPDGLNGVEVYR